MSSFRVIVIGLGVQGVKRRKHAGDDYVASVDPHQKTADFLSVKDVPLGDYDAALVCVPDSPKVELLKYLLKNGKHILVEKPLWSESMEAFSELEQLSQVTGAICYTAYNHRFEPHFVRMKELIASGELGKIYSCRMFYGNGTARLVRESEWRDRGSGVLPDLGSHLLDTCAYWFGDRLGHFELSAANAFENKAPDHVIISSEGQDTRIELEMTLLMWRNHFTCDVLAERGTAHIESLCKWGPSVFTHRTRVLPSGRPPEVSEVLVQEDPTWAAEYLHFKSLCAESKPSNLNHDVWLQETLGRLSDEVLR